MKVHDAISWGVSKLSGRTEGADSSSKYLLASALGVGLTEVYTQPERRLSTKEQRIFRDYIRKRSQKEPLWQIVGTDYFYGLPIYADSRVLVPRPETEFLVEMVIKHLRDSRFMLRASAPRVLDMGTGAGGIACALAVNLPKVKILASDISAEALEVARQNVEHNHLKTRVTLRRSDLFSDIPGSFDVIVANLPYVPTEDLGGLSFEIHHFEPRIALDGRTAGLEIYDRFFAELPPHLNKPGFVFAEIGHDQGRAIETLARTAFPRAEITTTPDYAGHDRYLLVESREERV